MVPTDEASTLFSNYHDRIYRYLLRLVHNPSEAEDLTQETFLRAHSHRDSLRDPKAVRPWLYRIATRICLDRLRRLAAHVSIESDEGAQSVGLVPSASPSALEVAERHETDACVQRCLDFLSDGYRGVILLHEAQSLTAAEIAELLGENVGTIKTRLHRARRKLHEIMQIGCAVAQGAKGVPCCEAKQPAELTHDDVRALLNK
jgi:RNA polymerase sigma-70 factor (ECF subfamily)